jgi:cytochrome oxidase Cu insertion factor (SCO1/SenC/PrrC family)
MSRSFCAVGLCLAVACVAAAGCRHTAASAIASGTSDPPHSQSAEMQDASIFDLDVALIDQDGIHARLEDLAGQTLVVSMMYGSCTSVCPRVTEEMKGIERQLGARAKSTKFVLFSLDPGRDTPQALRQFAATSISPAGGCSPRPRTGSAISPPSSTSNTLPARQATSPTPL